jgi:hypothetical protein
VFAGPGRALLWFVVLGQMALSARAQMQAGAL